MSQASHDRQTMPFRGGGRWAGPLLRPAPQLLLVLLAAVVALGLGYHRTAVGLAGLAILLALLRLAPELWQRLGGGLEESLNTRTAALLTLAGGLLVLTGAVGAWEPLIRVYASGNWEAIGALGEGVIGAFGQILVAFVALLIAWRQFQLDQRLSTQQNRITEAQTIDSFIHGISELISDREGMLDDWPLERMLAEGRLAAVLGSVEAAGKARILRFLAHARLLTPLRRDARVGRAILDGQGFYVEDRLDGIPVIQLHRSLRGVDLAGTDLRGVDFNGADLRGTILRGCDLRDANLAACDLAGADLSGAQLEGARFFQGPPDTASPIRTGTRPDGTSGAFSGAIVENVDVSRARQLSHELRLYLAAWSGKRSRQTIPGGSRGLPDRLGR
ncbi:MAG: pentapeptide repeat-containing protein [Cyanobacteriota bacterium]|nr:pentapeptide repeat-containing protein [Cyanobacteriota bacterium]